MGDRDDWRRAVEPAVVWFREVARGAFSALADLGYSEQALVDDREPFVLTWSDGRTVVEVRGVHWGTAAHTSVGTGAHRFALWRLVEKLRPEVTRSAVGQEAQIREDARVLLDIAQDVLRGDHSMFPALQADADERTAAAAERRRAEDQRLIDEGWAEVETFGGLALVPPESEYHPGFKKPR